MTTQIFKSFEEFQAREDKTVNGVSPDFANKHPLWEEMNETNRGCWNCTGCTRCIGCTGCIGCTRCFDCTGCTRCIGCTRCNGCTICTGCTDCIGCTRCNGCTICTGCTDCTSCFDCTGCNDCKYYVDSHNTDGKKHGEHLEVLDLIESRYGKEKAEKVKAILESKDSE